MPYLLKIAIVGAILGFLGAVGIYFEPNEPYPAYVTVAGTLNGVTIALLISAVLIPGRKGNGGEATAMPPPTSLGMSLLWGAIMGLLASVTVFLAKGGWTTWDAPFVVPTCVVTGVILGPIVRWLYRRDSAV